LQVSTFHTLGLKIIRQELKALDYKPGFSIFDAQDSAVLLKELARKEEVDEDDTARWQISSWKNDFITPAHAMELAQDNKEAFHARLEHLGHPPAVDAFDDLVLPKALMWGCLTQGILMADIKLPPSGVGEGNIQLVI
jgi:ATP-dependent DNA helicase Rep